MSVYCSCWVECGAVFHSLADFNKSQFKVSRWPLFRCPSLNPSLMPPKQRVTPSAHSVVPELARNGHDEPTVSFASTLFSSNMCGQLAQALKTNTTLQTLDLQHNRLKKAACMHLANGLPFNVTLRKLDLSYNECGDEGMRYFAPGLAANRGLKSLRLTANHLSAVAVGYVVEALKVNNCLQDLSFAENNIGDDGATMLAELLRPGYSLRTLALSSCKIGNAGAVSLAKALATNSTLISLNLSNNRIGEIGGFALAESLKRNNALQNLSISINKHVSEAVVAQLLRVLQGNRALTSLGIKSTGATFLQREAVATLLSPTCIERRRMNYILRLLQLDATSYFSRVPLDVVAYLLFPLILGRAEELV